MARPVGPDALRRQQDVDAAAGAQVEHALAFAELRDRRRVAAAERREDGGLRQLRLLERGVQPGADRLRVAAATRAALGAGRGRGVAGADLLVDRLGRRGGRHGSAASSGSADAGVLILVDIDSCQYAVRHEAPTDPDVLLLQGAADPTRLAILRQLGRAPTVCACDFTSCCDVAQPTVCHHLKVLRDTGWVRSERRGSFIYYFLLPAAVAAVRPAGRGLLAGGPVPMRAPGRSLPVVQPPA